MSTVQCPLCGLRFGHRSEFELHAREDHVTRKVALNRPQHQEQSPLPPPREAREDEHAPVIHLPW